MTTEISILAARTSFEKPMGSDDETIGKWTRIFPCCMASKWVYGRFGVFRVAESDPQANQRSRASRSLAKHASCHLRSRIVTLVHWLQRLNSVPTNVQRQSGSNQQASPDVIFSNRQDSTQLTPSKVAQPHLST